jgi:hypothetical protein
MARNRKSESAAARLAPALKALLLCIFFVISGVGYVWYKNQVSVLGREIKAREVRLAELERQNKVRRDQLAALSSPVVLDARVKKLNLGLVPPPFFIRLAEPLPESPQWAQDRTVGLREARAESAVRGN